MRASGSCARPLWVFCALLSGQVLLARSLLSATAQDRGALLGEIQQALPVPITGIVTDGQTSLRHAVAQALPDVPHQLCHFHLVKATLMLRGRPQTRSGAPGRRGSEQDPGQKR